MKYKFCWSMGLLGLFSFIGWAADRPNIIVILVDDMGFSDVSCYGGEIPTPHLDALAKNGIRFSQFYNTGRCCPTRASLLTGLYAHQAGVGWMTNDQGAPGYLGRLNEHCVTLGDVMKSAGYFTAMVGKWHVGHDRGGRPVDRGFLRSLNLEAGGLHYSNQTGFKGDTVLYLNGEPIARDDPQFHPPWYGTDLWTEQGIKFIDEALEEKKPFFLYLAHVAPHFPCMAPEATIAKYRGQYKAGWDALRKKRFERQKEIGLIDPQWELTPRVEAIPAWDRLSAEEQTRYDDMMAIYAAMMEEVDKNIGKLTDALQKRGQYENTLILFLSDNGGNAESGIKGHHEGAHPGDPDSHVFVGQCWAQLSNTPFRKYKHFNHEGGIATPLVAHWPAKICGGDWETTPAHLIDIMATCVDVAGATYPQTRHGQDVTPMQGVSLLPLLTRTGTLPARPLFWEHEGNAAIRVGDRKLVRAGQNSGWELFDMKTDRTEQHDLAGQFPEEVKTLTKQWTIWAKQAQVLPKPASKRKPNAIP